MLKTRPRSSHGLFWPWPSLLGWILAWAASGWVALGEQRFPPPEFETDYVMRGIPTPAPRGMAFDYLDVGVLAAALGLAAWLVHRRRSRRGLVVLSVGSLLYFGFYREGCICPIGAPQNVAYGLFHPAYAIPWTVLAFFLLPLIFSLFSGRTFCAGVCPHGALQDLVLIKPVKIPLWLEQGLGMLPFVYLGAGVLFAAAGAGFVICRWDPFVPLFRMTGSLLMLTLGGVFLVTSMFVGRPFCRFLCPYGALLRLGSVVSKWRVRITPSFCTQCRLCEASCPFGAIREPLPAPKDPALLGRDRRRLGWQFVALPLLIGLGAWLGSLLSAPAARLHPTVALMERYLESKTEEPDSPPAAPTPESRALGRAELHAPALLAEAVEVRRRLGLGGGWFGGWVGLVLGARLISLSVRTTRTDFEPERGSCFACGRCYLACPNERVRLGWITPAEAAGLTPRP